MAGRPPKKKKVAVGSETSSSIAEQTAAFLKAGGEIEQIKKGTSGQVQTTGRKHIVISSNHNK